MVLIRLKPHTYDVPREGESITFHNAFHGPYFCHCIHVDEGEEPVTIFTELLNGNVYRQAIFSRLKEGEYSGHEAGLDIAYPPEWRRREYGTGKFQPNIHIFGDGYF